MEKVKNMKYLAMIQARCGSTRLHNKVLKELEGKTDIERVIERVHRSKSIDETMLITSIDKENLPLIELCAGIGVRVFVGSEDDVLDRYYQAARLLSPEYIIRITGDCPLFDWRYLDKAIDSLDEKTDYLWMGEDAFPDGLDFEIMTFKALEKSWREARFSSEREHVTVYIRNHPELFNIQVYDFPIRNAGHYRWTLDEESDYEVIKSIYGHFIKQGKEIFVTEDIIDYLKSHPEIEKINSGIGRNEGLAKSIAEDKLLDERKE